MEKTFLVVTSIADDKHPILNQLAKEAEGNNFPFILVGDTKSPKHFNLHGCGYYSIEQQLHLDFKLAQILPEKHYARKNLGYLIAMNNGAEVIIETDDDNIPIEGFWAQRSRMVDAYLLENKGWINIYNYFTKENIWPRGFSLEHLKNELPSLTDSQKLQCPIQQGLADENPDVDAIYRLIMPLPLTFNRGQSIALGNGTICPFNSQNTTWFKEAFMLMYLPSYCSFRMTDIWRSFVAQRIAWTCGWPVLFHKATVRQERNDHRLMQDFNEEIPGYLNNQLIVDRLNQLDLKKGVENIPENLIRCYTELIAMGVVGEEEMQILEVWISDLSKMLKH